MKKFAFLAFVLFFFFITDTIIFAQLQKISNPDIYTEGNFYTDGKILYADAIVLKFKKKVFDLAKGEKKVDKSNINQVFSNLLNTFNNYENRFGKIEFIKQIPDAEWGDTIRTNKFGELIRIHDLSQLFTVRFSQPVPLDSTLEIFKNFPEVEFAEQPVSIMYLFAPNDDYFVNGDQWNLAVVDATKAWDITKGNSSIIIGIVDTGAKQDHIDLANKIEGGDGLEDSSPHSNGHGTFVAGIAGAETNNSEGVASLGYGVSIYTYGGNINDDNHLAQQITTASNYCHIINMSWVIVQVLGLDEYQELCPSCTTAAYINFWRDAVLDGMVAIPSTHTGIQQAIANAISLNGTIFVASGGNGSQNPDYPSPEICDPWQVPFTNNPSAYPNVIAISGTYWNVSLLTEHILAGWNHGPAIDFAAPGYTIWSTTKVGGYSFDHGTSFASPHVAALVGLMKSVNPSLTLVQIYDILKSTADKIDNIAHPYDGNGWNEYLGYGRINAHKALLEVLNILANENKSANQTATSNNNGRRLVKESSSNYHLVFASGGEIFYRKSTDGGINWLAPIRLSTGNGNNNYPSVSESSGRVYITWQRNTSSNNYDIYFAASTNAGSNWNIKYVLNSVTTTTDPLPSIQAASTYEMIVFRYGSGIKSYWSYYTTPTDQSYWVVRTTGFSTSYSPTVTSAYQSPTYYFPMAMANSSDNHIYYYYFDTYTTNWAGGPNNLSSIVPGSNSVHITPSITSVPGTSQVHVAWKKLIGSGSSIYDHLIIHRKSTNYTSWPNEWFGTYYNNQENPSISALATNKVDLLYNTPSQFGTQYVYKLRFNGYYWNQPTWMASNARYPSVSSGSTTAKYVWTSGSSSPYTVMLSSELLQKELEINPLDYYTRSIAWLDSVGSYLEIKLHPFYLNMKDGSKKRIDIVPASLDTFDLTLSNSWDLLSSIPIQIPSDAAELVFDYSVSGSDIKNLFTESLTNVQPAFGLVNGKSEVIATTTQNHIVDADKIQEIRKQTSLSLTGMSDQKNVRALIKLDGLKPKEGVFASLGHIEDYSSLPDQYQKQIEEIEAVVKVDEYNIQNYPNPFNPTTNIQYSIKEAVFVTIKVYDILGRELTTLVNEEKPVGIYTINFNGSSLSSGLYFYHIQVGSFIQTKKMILTK